MFSPFRWQKGECNNFRDAMNEVEGAATLPAFLAHATPRQRSHAAACEDCRKALEELLATRLLLTALQSQADMSRPWFASRVMSAIAAREAEYRRLATAWTVVPKLASRLVLASAVAILVAGTWLYKSPVASISGQIVTEASAESVFESSPPSHQDDVFLSTVEKNQ